MQLGTAVNSDEWWFWEQTRQRRTNLMFLAFLQKWRIVAGEIEDGSRPSPASSSRTEASTTVAKCIPCTSSVCRMQITGTTTHEQKEQPLLLLPQLLLQYYELL